MKKLSGRTQHVLDREQEELRAYKFKYIKLEDLQWFEKRVNKYFRYYADPELNVWELEVVLPNQEVHILKTFKNMKALLQSAAKAKLIF